MGQESSDTKSPECAIRDNKRKERIWCHKNNKGERTMHSKELKQAEKKLILIGNTARAQMSRMGAWHIARAVQRVEKLTTICEYEEPRADSCQSWQKIQSSSWHIPMCWVQSGDNKKNLIQ